MRTSQPPKSKSSLTFSYSAIVLFIVFLNCTLIKIRCAHVLATKEFIFLVSPSTRYLKLIPAKHFLDYHICLLKLSTINCFITILTTQKEGLSNSQKKIINVHYYFLAIHFSVHWPATELQPRLAAGPRDNGTSTLCNLIFFFFYINFFCELASNYIFLFCKPTFLALFQNKSVIFYLS